MQPNDPRHGSENGYQGHRRANEPACPPCRHAHSALTSAARKHVLSPRTLTHRARIEDLAWMAETGEHAEGAAQRLGLNYVALETWARRHAPDTWAVLVARKPRDWNLRYIPRNQRGAA